MKDKVTHCSMRSVVCAPFSCWLSQNGTFDIQVTFPLKFVHILSIECVSVGQTDALSDVDWSEGTGQRAGYCSSRGNVLISNQTLLYSLFSVALDVGR